MKNPEFVYPSDFYKYTNTKNFNLFWDNLLIVCERYLTLKLIKEEIQFDSLIFFCKPIFHWLDMHFHWCVKKFYEDFLESQADNDLINNIWKRNRIYTHWTIFARNSEVDSNYKKSWWIQSFKKDKSKEAKERD